MKPTLQQRLNRINGFEVTITKDGREVAPNPQDDTLRKRINGPHHDAVWARRLLGTDMSQAEYRRRRIGLLLGISLGLFSGCAPVSEPRIDEFKYHGHDYLIFRVDGNYGQTYVHDPDCACHRALP